MSVIPPADPRDVQDFQFKLLCRLRVFGGQDGIFSNAVNLVAPASKYGLIFVGCPTGLQVVTSSSIVGLEHPSGSGGEISNYPKRELPLPSQPTHLSLSCDQNFLVVAVIKDSCPHGLIYSVPSFLSKNITQVSEVRLSSKADSFVLELTWNPGISNILAACLSDGSMAAFEVKPSGLELSTLPPAAQATCFCWSPKGKQLVVGSVSGTLTQYKPDLSAVKTLSAPNLGSGSVAVVNVLWLSNYQFAAIYRDKVNTDERPALLIVNAPKAGDISFVNYEDICYSEGKLRLPQFYLIHQPSWNILMVASANSMEVGVLGLQKDQISWEQWTQEDAARAELPLTLDKQETFPIGLGLDTSTQNELPWGENQSLPPMPVLHILSHQGVLCLFYAVNLRPDAPRICAPPEKLSDESGLAMFSTISSLPTQIQQQESAQTQEQPIKLQSGKALTSGDGSLGGLRINLAPKFDSVTTTQPSLGGVAAPVPNLFGQGPGLSGTQPPAFGTGLMGAPSINFGSSLASTSSSSSIFGSGPATTTSSSFSGGLSTAPTFATGLLGSSSTSFGAASVGFGTVLNNPPTTSISTSSVPAFSSAVANPPSIGFGTGLGGQPPILGSVLTNTPTVGFGTGLSFAGTATSKPTLSFQTTTAAAPATAPASNVKSSIGNLTFATPGATSTPQQPLKPSQQPSIGLQNTGVAKPHINLFGSGMPALQVSEQLHASAVNLTKPQPSLQQSKTEVATSEVKQSQVKPVAPPAVAPPAKPTILPAVNSSVFFNAVNEEVTHFEHELADLRTRVTGINIQVGTEEEKRMLRLKVDLLDEFWRELKETTQAQSSEIHSLKSELLEAFAWAEEAKSRTQQLNSPMYLQLTRSQSLDPVTARSASNIKHLVYYVENQLRQVNEQLDCNWLEFQESCKPGVKNKMHIPTLEAVYQAMVMQNNILNKQRVIMADIARRAQDQGRTTQIPLISTAVLARVRDKEASQLGKGETELSRLAENLVQLKLGPPVMHINHHCRRLSRKKESLLRELLSQCTVTRICPTKPLRSTVGGISTGKPIVTKIDSSVTVSNKDMSRLSSAAMVTEQRSYAASKLESSQAPLFMFGSGKVSGEVATSLGSHSFSVIMGKQPGKDTTSAVTLPGGLSTEASRAKPNISDSTLIHKLNTQASVLPSKANVVPSTTSGQYLFNAPLQSGKTSIPENFSFATGLTKVPSVGKLPDVSKRLEDYYEEVSPPRTPEHAFKDPAPSPAATTSGTSFSFSLTNTGKSGTLPSNTVSNMGSALQKSPLMSLDSIVAGIGDNSTTKTSKPADISKPSVSLSTAVGSGAFSFGSLSLGQSQQAGKTEELKRPAETFKFSLPPTFNTVTTSSISVDSGDNVQVTALKLPSTAATSIAATTTVTTTTASISLKTPLFTSFGTDNRQPSTTQVNIFGGGENQKSTISFAATGSAVTSSSSNIFAQASTSIFSNSGSPAKQPMSTISIFGAPTTTVSTPSLTFGKQTMVAMTSTTTTTTESQQKKTESPQKDDKTSTAATSSSDNLFSQGTSMFGSLSVGTTGSPAKSIGNIFGGSSTNFSFGKPSTPSDDQTSNPAENITPGIQNQKSESPAKDTQSIVKPSAISTFGQPSSVVGEQKPETTETNVSQSTLNTPSVFGSGKAESATNVSFSFGQAPSSTVSTNTSQTPLLFGQAKPLTGPVFGAAVTATVTSQQTAPPVTSTTLTSATTPTTSTPSSTFTFSLPASTQPSSPFGQQQTSLFGQPVSTTAATTTASSSFFGQAICSPTGFGQGGGNIFGQPATATTKTNMFGQTTPTTTAPSVFGQGAATTTQPVFGQSSSTSPFGQAPAAGSSFLGGTSGGFGSKPAFGQSGSSIFGQSGSTGFGSSGGSMFGGGGATAFGGGTGSSGNLFQSSSGGSIFGGSGSPGSGTTTGGAFSSGLGQSISQSGFGSPTAFQTKPGAFGGSPVFDRGTSGFGSPPTFGGAPTFGGSPTFGSPGKVFGSSSPTSSVAFGTTGQQQSSTFENLANQNTMTFGNLAQTQGQAFGSTTQSVFGGSSQTQAPSTPAFSGGSAFGASQH